jgi:hypothetical protein
MITPHANPNPADRGSSWAPQAATTATTAAEGSGNATAARAGAHVATSSVPVQRRTAGSTSRLAVKAEPASRTQVEVGLQRASAATRAPEHALHVIAAPTVGHAPPAEGSSVSNGVGSTAAALLLLPVQGRLQSRARVQLQPHDRDNDAGVGASSGTDSDSDAVHARGDWGQGQDQDQDQGQGQGQGRASGPSPSRPHARTWAHVDQRGGGAAGGRRVQPAPTFSPEDLPEPRMLPNGRVACTWPGCTSTFSDPYGVRRHMRSHTGTKPYPCHYDGCGKAFGHRQSLDYHIAAAHKRERPFKCTAVPGCRFSFPTAASLRAHVQRCVWWPRTRGFQAV